MSTTHDIKIPKGIFEAAFQKLIKCKPGELITEVLDDHLSAKVVYNGQPYNIATWERLFEDVKFMLIDTGQAQLMHVNVWYRAVNGILNNPDFFLRLTNKLEPGADAINLNLALSISSQTPDHERIFWELLKKLDLSLFGKAVVTAASCYDIDDLVSDVLQRRLMHGDTEYNELVDGMFASVSIPIKQQRQKRFYVFTTGG